jgi:hypothetical protein
MRMSPSPVPPNDSAGGPLRLAIARLIASQGPLPLVAVYQQVSKEVQTGFYRVEGVTTDHPWFDLDHGKLHLTPVGFAAARGELEDK